MGSDTRHLTHIALTPSPISPANHSPGMRCGILRLHVRLFLENARGADYRCCVLEQEGPCTTIEAQNCGCRRSGGVDLAGIVCSGPWLPLLDYTWAPLLCYGKYPQRPGPSRRRITSSWSISRYPSRLRKHPKSPVRRRGPGSLEIPRKRGRPDPGSRPVPSGPIPSNHPTRSCIGSVHRSTR
jgi:hypothetical protein